MINLLHASPPRCLPTSLYKLSVWGSGAGPGRRSSTAASDGPSLKRALTVSVCRVSCLFTLAYTWQKNAKEMKAKVALLNLNLGLRGLFFQQQKVPELFNTPENYALALFKHSV